MRPAAYTVDLLPNRGVSGHYLPECSLSLASTSKLICIVPHYIISFVPTFVAVLYFALLYFAVPYFTVCYLCFNIVYFAVLYFALLYVTLLCYFFVFYVLQLCTCICKQNSVRESEGVPRGIIRPRRAINRYRVVTGRLLGSWVWD